MADIAGGFAPDWLKEMPTTTEDPVLPSHTLNTNMGFSQDYLGHEWSIAGGNLNRTGYAVDPKMLKPFWKKFFDKFPSNPRPVRSAWDAEEKNGTFFLLKESEGGA